MAPRRQPYETDGRRAQWLKGVLEPCLLGVLSQGEAYGYEIAQQLERAGLGEVKGGTLYPRLSAMETAGLVEVEWRVGDNGPGRKYYRLTPAGRAAQQEAAADFRRFTAVALALVEGSPVPPPPPPTGPPLAGGFVNLEETRR